MTAIKPDRMRRFNATRSAAFAVKLAEVNLELLATRVPSLGLPMNVESDCARKACACEEDPVDFGFDGRSLLVERVLLPLARDLWERENNLTVPGHGFLALYELVDVVSVEKDGYIRREVAARIGEGEDASFAVPLSSPFNVGLIGLIGQLPLADRVRVLTELVRVLGNLVCFAGLGERINGNLVGGLRELVSSLRSAIRTYRSEKAEQTDNAADAGGDDCGKDLDGHATECSGASKNTEEATV